MMGMREAAELANRLEGLYRSESPSAIDFKDIERLVFLIRTGSDQLQLELEAYNNDGI